jgi:hypothetical protein
MHPLMPLFNEVHKNKVCAYFRRNFSSRAALVMVLVVASTSALWTVSANKHYVGTCVRKETSKRSRRIEDMPSELFIMICEELSVRDICCLSEVRRALSFLSSSRH